mgnify:CR=1 FL=1
MVTATECSFSTAPTIVSSQNTIVPIESTLGFATVYSQGSESCNQGGGLKRSKRKSNRSKKKSKRTRKSNRSKRKSKRSSYKMSRMRSNKVVRGARFQSRPSASYYYNVLEKPVGFRVSYRPRKSGKYILHSLELRKNGSPYWRALEALPKRN